MAQVQEQVQDSVIRFAFKTAKLSKAILLWLWNHSELAKRIDESTRARTNARIQKKTKVRLQKLEKHGKMKVKELVGQNQGVTSIDIEKTPIRDFKKYCRKYGIDYAIKKETGVETPKYIVFFKARDADAMTMAFSEYTRDYLSKAEKKQARAEKQQTREKKPSILKRLAGHRQSAEKGQTKARSRTKTDREKTR